MSDIKAGDKVLFLDTAVYGVPDVTRVVRRVRENGDIEVRLRGRDGFVVRSEEVCWVYRRSA